MIELNGKPVNTTLFPDNTSQVWQLPEELLNGTDFANITWRFATEGEFMQLAQLKMLLDSYNFKTCLRIPYLPYGRQDKPVANNATFALRSFAELLNSLKFDEVIVTDPHSPVAGELINNFQVAWTDKIVYHINELTKTDILAYPDKGALEKYRRIIRLPFIYGEKVRDQLTGKILSYNVVGECAGKNVLIVDDICDGGMTFKLLAKDLLAAGAKEVNLFVSHGIFSQGLRTLKESKINRIFTKDGEVSEVQNCLTYRRL